MIDDRQARAAAFGLLGFTALTGLGWFLWAKGGVPSWGSRPEVFAAWYEAHRTESRLGALLGTLGLLPFLVFVCASYDVLRRASESSLMWARLSLVGGILTAVVHFAFLTFLYAAALRPGIVDASTTATMHDLFLVTAGTAPVIYLAMIGGYAAATRNSETGGGLVYRVSWFAAAVQLLPLGVPFSGDGLFDPARGLFGVFLPFGGLFLWAVIVAAGLFRAAGHPHAQGQAA